MSTQSYLINSTFVAHCEFSALDTSSATAIKSGTRELADPTTVTCAVTSPSNVTTTYTYPATVTKVSTGFYYVTVQLTAAGDWTILWTGTGAAASVSRRVVRVHA